MLYIESVQYTFEERKHSKYDIFYLVVSVGFTALD